MILGAVVPLGVNAGYFQVVDRHQIKLRVWERGAGETLSCGTGACAAAVTAIQRKLADSPLQVEMGKRGRQLVKEKFTWERVAPQMIELYRHILSGHNGRS